MSTRAASRKHTVHAGTPEAQIIVRYQIELPEQIADQFEEQAIARNMSVEPLIEERLKRTVGQRGSGLWFDEAHKRRLDKAIGHTVSDAEGVLQRVEHLMSFTIEDVAVELEPRVIQRLASRAKALRKTFGQFVREETRLALRRVTGIDPA